MKIFKSIKFDKVFIIIAGVVALLFLCLATISINKNTEEPQTKASTGFTSVENLVGGSNIYLSSNTIHKISGSRSVSGSIIAPNNGTSVIYLEDNARLWVRSQSYQLAGIEVPTSSRLIIVGGKEAVVDAYGKDAERGIIGSYGQSGYMTGPASPVPGRGGNGGKGGNGASAGIGGHGGQGGQGGQGGNSGSRGYDGVRGGNSTGMGYVYILGSINVNAQGGRINSYSVNPAGSGNYVSNTVNYRFYSAGGGGGGGCGGNGFSANNIGEGGPGGGGGGGGGGGATYSASATSAKVIYGGLGGQSGYGYGGRMPSGRDARWDYSCGPSGGIGASEGYRMGGPNILYTQDGKTVSGREGKYSDGKIPELQYTVTFDKQSGTGGTVSSSVYLCQTMDTIEPPTRKGYTFNGYYSEQNGGGTLYYSPGGTATKEWDLIGDTKLYASWIPNTYTVTFQDGNIYSKSVRYIKDTLIGGSTANSSNHWLELQAFSGLTNVANKNYGATSKFDDGTITTDYLLNGSIDLDDWKNPGMEGVATNYQIVDLGQVQQVDRIVVWHYYGDARKYNKNILEVSEDGVNWRTIFSTEETGIFTEKEQGNSVIVNAYRSKQVDFNAEYGTMPSLTKYGYDCTGWYTSASGGTKISSTTIMTTEGASIYAQWTPKSYQVSYNANGGSGTMTSRQFNFGQSTQLAANEFEKTGYTFMGWSEQVPVADNYDATEQAKKVKYLDRGYLTLTEEAGKELYAVWRNNKYYVRYNANGTTDDPVTGSLPNSTHYYNISSSLANNIATTNSNGFKRRGFTFVGWSTDSSATTSSQCISSVSTLTESDNAIVDLYAIWSRNVYTISFNSNGGSGLTTSLPMLYNNGEYTLPNCGFTKVGYLFKGWMKNEDDAKDENIKDVDFKNCAKVNSYDYVSNVTYYAKWEATWAVTKNNSFDGGTGEDTDPYQIKTADQLAYLSKEVQNGSTFENIYFEQTAPIDLSGKIWMPIGGSNTATSFSGYYNGRGFAIIGLETYNQTDASGNQLFSNVGLFGRTSGATLTNVYLANANIVGNQNVGGLVGENVGKNLTLYGCFVRGDVSGLSNVGGLIGSDEVLTLQISNCGFAGDVNGGSIIAGGAEYGIIKNCYAEVDSDISFCGDNAEVVACVYSAGGSKRYYDDTATGQNYFEDWKTYNGKPLPKGLTWIGGVASGTFSLDGYTKVD